MMDTFMIWGISIVVVWGLCLLMYHKTGKKSIFLGIGMLWMFGSALYLGV